VAKWDFHLKTADWGERHRFL